jgi:hypothetical protein
MTATMFINCVTSDLLKKDRSLADDSQPWCVWVCGLLEVPGRYPQCFSLAVKAEGRKVRAGAEAVHGLSSRDAAKHGVSEVVVLGDVCGLAAQAECVVGHGIDFDKDVITSLLMRRDKSTKLWVRPGLRFFDTMALATPFCRLPRAVNEDGSFKWPSLREASEILLKETVEEGPHDPMNDLERVRRLWGWLVANNAVADLEEVK